MKKRTIAQGVVTVLAYIMVIVYLSSCSKVSPGEVTVDEIESVEVNVSDGIIRAFTHDGITYTIYNPYGQGKSPILLDKKRVGGCRPIERMF